MLFFFPHTVSSNILFPFATSFFLCLYCLWFHTSPCCWSNIPQTHTSDLLTLPLYVCSNQSPVVFEHRSLFPEEVSRSQEALVLFLHVSYFTAFQCHCLSFHHQHNHLKAGPILSCLPICSETLLIEFLIKIPAKITRPIEDPCWSDEICISFTCADSDSCFEPPVSVVNSAVHTVSCKANKLSTESHRENRSWEGSPGASHYTEASKQ